MTRLTRHVEVTTAHENAASTLAHPAERAAIYAGKRGQQ